MHAIPVVSIIQGDGPEPPTLEEVVSEGNDEIRATIARSRVAVSRDRLGRKTRVLKDNVGAFYASSGDLAGDGPVTTLTIRALLGVSDAVRVAEEAKA